MTENAQGSQNPIRVIVVAVVALIVIVGVIVVVVQRSAGEQGVSAPTSTTSSTPTSTTSSTPTSDMNTTGEDDVQGMASSSGSFLDEEMSGQEAIDALGDRLGAVAERNGMTEERLVKVLQNDPSAWVTPNGFIKYKDDRGKNKG